MSDSDNLQAPNSDLQESGRKSVKGVLVEWKPGAKGYVVSFKIHGERSPAEYVSLAGTEIPVTLQSWNSTTAHLCHLKNPQAQSRLGNLYLRFGTEKITLNFGQRT